MRNKKILIVDDELEIAELIKDYLEEEQYDVEISTDGVECLAVFREYQPHLIVLDIMNCLCHHVTGYSISYG